MPSLSATGADQRHDDERELEEVEEEGQQEEQDVDDDQEAELAARQAGQQVLDPHVAVDAAERQAEHGRADQDEEDEARQLHGRVHRLAHQLQVSRRLRERHHEGADRAHRAALGRAWRGR